MSKAEIGVIGLGVMGANLALNIAEKGHTIAVHNRTSARTGAFFNAAGDLRERIVPCASLKEFVAEIKPPRPIILMVKAGKAVDEQIAALRELMAADDIIIDAGNANFRDTVRHVAELESSGLQFIGMGVSGGAEGARHGPSIMVGGPVSAYRQIEPILRAIAADYKGEPCCAWLGPGGAGHFVKTLHNGIEYADMQMIAEIYGILRDGAGMSAPDIGAVFTRWNQGPLNSYLVEIAGEVLGTWDKESGGPLVDVIRDQAGQKGTGRWAAIESQLMGVAATAIESAVAARNLSAEKSLRGEASELYRDLRTEGRIDADADFVADLEMALLAGKIAAYAQGFSVMEEASAEFKWQMPLATVARIWRAGCIIRSQFLDTIATALEREDRQERHLLLLPDFAEMMRKAHLPLRRVVARASLTGLPVPALSAALGYFDTFRQSRGTANLIQAQRDYFGAHGFERLDAEGEHHGAWGRFPPAFG